jgi:pilus assembly protein CpaB
VFSSTVIELHSDLGRELAAQSFSMNRRMLIIVSCALVLALCASYLVYRTAFARVTAAQAAPTVQIVVAARNLVVGTLIHDNDLKMAAWLGSPPAGAILKSDGLPSRGVVSTIYEGEPVTENRLAPIGSGGGLAATIPPGMRACAVKVNEVVGVAGFVVPGMRVDVLVTGLPPGDSTLDGPKVRTLLQNIQVLSAGTNFLKDQEGKPEQAQVVNLLVTPAQAELLSLASNETHIQLILRNPMDTQVSGLPGTMMSDVFGRVREPVPVPRDRPKREPPAMHPLTPLTAEPPAPIEDTVEVINGSVHTKARAGRPGGEQ